MYCTIPDLVCQLLMSPPETLRLEARLLHRIVFGTAGLRAVMRAGFDSMNDLVIIQ